LNTEKNTKDEVLDFLNEFGLIYQIYKLNSHPNSHVNEQARNFILVHSNVPENDVFQQIYFKFSKLKL